MGKKSKPDFNRNKSLIIMMLIFCWSIQQSYAQTEVAPWGNIKGIRVEGQLMDFESSLRVVGENWQKISITGKEKQRPKYNRNGNTQIISTKIDSLYFNEKIKDTGIGKAEVNITVTSSIDTILGGIYLAVELPDEAIIQLSGAKAMALNNFALEQSAKLTTSSVRFNSSDQQLLITWNTPSVLTIRKESGKYVLYLPIREGKIKKGQPYLKSFQIETSGKVDKQPVTLQLNTAIEGRLFAGFGGNFRIQNLKTDPQVIDYSLQNLRLAWGRVEMPWHYWKDSTSIDPHVQRAMEMAQKLAKKNIPIILTAWSAPDWAIEGKPKFQPTPDGIWGNPLDSTRTQDIYKSITGYLLYLKQHYGVEVRMFSFNESDLGINIRQTGLQHAELIKGLGAYFQAKGLKTKMLLGDNSDATTYSFIVPASNDVQARKFIQAVSFHSWRGWETGTLQKWAEAATKLGVPLIVGEGSIDAAAWNYPAVFAEPTYALQEINLYTRLLAICQPLTILQWQLTADYSPLAGGGIFGDNGPLRPTQRWWNLKQLSSTPEHVYAMPITTDQPNISSAALGNQKTGVYCIHLVNNGAARTLTINGFPKSTTSLKMYVTDQKRAMKEEKKVLVKNGTALFILDSQSFTTLMTE